MEDVKIVVVEDEAIVAKDIQQTLIKLGYSVPAIANSYESAMEKIAEELPDLVFMDIRLKGDIDGVDIAGEIKSKYDIPVIFLTSYVDKTTLDRAKVTEPYGYIVKPFHETDLRTAVEIAMYKSSKDRAVKQHNEFYFQSLHSLEEAVVLADESGKITFANTKAKHLANSPDNGVVGSDIFSVFDIRHEKEGPLNLSKIKEITRVASENSKNPPLIVIQDKQHVADLHASLIKDEKNQIIGYAFVMNSINGEEQKSAPAKPADQHQQMGEENLFLANSFFVKKGSLLVKVGLENVLWVQAMDNYVIIKTESDQFIVHSSLRDIESKLPPDKFVRVHRSYIVALEKISLMDENTLIISEKTIPVGKSYRDHLMKKLSFL